MSERRHPTPQDFKDNGCCEACRVKAEALRVIMIVCKTCGNKRCPKAENHEFRCTGSNEPGQVGETEVAFRQRMKEAGERATAIVATWPEWKRRVLGYFNNPTVAEPRMPAKQEIDAAELAELRRDAARLDALTNRDIIETVDFMGTTVPFWTVETAKGDLYTTADGDGKTVTLRDCIDKAIADAAPSRNGG